MLNSHFDEVERDHEGQLGLFKVSHRKYGSCFVDALASKVIQCDNREMGEFVS